MNGNNHANIESCSSMSDGNSTAMEEDSFTTIDSTKTGSTSVTSNHNINTLNSDTNNTPTVTFTSSLLSNGNKSSSPKPNEVHSSHFSFSRDTIEATESSMFMCVKPDWITHEGNAIYSCAIDASGTRLATAGADNCVRLWAIPPIVDPSKEIDSSHPRLLSRLNAHLAAVNAVAFSHNGELLASASDGESPTVILWKHVPHDPNSELSTPFATNHNPLILHRPNLNNDSISNSSHLEMKPSESWTVQWQLREHSADVQDIAFSLDDKFLASASVDNTVCVWTLTSNPPALLRKLHGHTGWVKGVAWDPLGRYLASHGDDHRLIIWSTDDWTECARITDCLKGEKRGLSRIIKQITFNRLSWSPCGSVMGVSRGFTRDSAASSVIFSRGSWKRKCLYIGNRHPTTCTRFNPQLFTPFDVTNASELSNDLSSRQHSLPDTNTTDALSTFSIFAVGSMDTTITIWSTRSPRPIFHLKGFFKQSVEDLCWSADGFALVACSHDGTIAAFRFSQTDFGGKPLTQGEKNTFLRSIYGDNVLSGSIDIPESALLEQLGEVGKKMLNADLEKIESSQNSSSQANIPDAKMNIAMMQREVRTSTGKRRIIPVSVSATNSFQPPILPPSIVNPPTTTPTMSSPIVQSPSTEFPTIPTVISSSSIPPASKPPPFASTSIPSILSLTKISSSSPNTPSNESNPPSSSNRNSFPSKENSTPSLALSSTIKPHSRVRHLIEPYTPREHLVCKLPTRNDFQTATSHDSPTTNILNELVEACWTLSNAHRDIATAPYAWSTLVCRRSIVEQWRIMLPGQIVAMAPTKGHLVCCCQEEGAASSINSVMYVLSLFGRRLLPPIHLPSLVSRLTTNDHFVLIITSDGQLRLWNLQLSKCTVRTLLHSLLSPAIKFKDCFVTSSGIPIVLLSNQSLYMFDNSMEVWMNISDQVYFGSEFRSLMHLSSAMASNDLQSLANLQRHTKLDDSTELNNTMMAASYTPDNTTKSLYSIAHLETQISCSQALQSTADYYKWLFMYIKYLINLANSVDLNIEFTAMHASSQHLTSTQSNSISAPQISTPLTTLALTRLHELVHEFLGPIYRNLPQNPNMFNDQPSTSIVPTPLRNLSSETSLFSDSIIVGTSSDWSPTVCGVDKHKFLESILPLLATCRQLQKLTAYTSNALEEYDKRSSINNIVSTSTANVTPHGLFPL